MTRRALNLCGYVNGVARRHATTTRDMFPGYSVDSVTNGVHAATWTHPAFAALFEAEIPHWTAEPELLARADTLDDAAIRSARETARSDLRRLVQARVGVDLDPQRSEAHTSELQSLMRTSYAVFC